VNNGEQKTISLERHDAIITQGYLSVVQQRGARLCI